jgi:hypothetical protein
MWLREILLCALLVGSAAGGHAAWTPEDWEDGSTLRFETVDPDHERRWSTVWYVVLYGDVYARLGADAAERIERNVKSPYVRIEIGGERFDDVRADPANDMARSVDAAMADKYPTDFLFRFLPHPMVVRLRAASH